jgi:ATP-binding cassette subfamily B protein/subfamily B ATP-binding cassette protein MsbA
MLHRQRSSRRRFRDYLQTTRSNRNFIDEPTDDSGKRPDKRKLQRSFRVIFLEFWKLLRGHRPVVLASLATLTLAVGLNLFQPASTKIVIDYILTDHPGPSGIPAWARVSDDPMTLLVCVGAAMIAIALLNLIVGMWGRYQITRLTKRVQALVRRRAFDHAVRLPLHRVQALKTGGAVSVLRDDAGQAADLLFTMIYNPWRAIVQLAGTLVILAFVDWRMLLGAVLLVPAVWVSQRTWIARIRPVYRDIRMTRTSIDAHTTEAFGGMRVVRGFGRTRSESSRFSRSNHFMARQEMRAWWWSRILDSVWSLLIPVASVGLLLYGGSQVIKGGLTLGDVMMFSTYLLMLLSPLETLTSTAANIQSNLAGFDRILDLLEEPTEFQDSPGLLSVRRERVSGRIELRDVWFAYPKSRPGLLAERAREGPVGSQTDPQREPVIRGVSMTVEPGETIALVGPSGSGKTTLCNLIARFYDPTRGDILFDGVNLRDIDVAQYRRILGIVEQDVFLFDGTIAENIAYGRRDCTLAQIIEAARAADAHGFIEKQEKKYETLIGERGVRLSGGQKQRLAIARAILADPAVLILDEATSNLDSESEALIQTSLGRLMRGRTCFVIAHRLSTVRSASRIAVMENGAITEFGPHDVLWAKGGRYAELLRAQLQGYREQLDDMAAGSSAESR